MACPQRLHFFYMKKRDTKTSQVSFSNIDRFRNWQNEFFLAILESARMQANFLRTNLVFQAIFLWIWRKMVNIWGASQSRKPSTFQRDRDWKIWSGSGFSLLNQRDRDRDWKIGRDSGFRDPGIANTKIMSSDEKSDYFLAFKKIVRFLSAAHNQRSDYFLETLIWAALRTLTGVPVSILSHGVHVYIIDFTNSRLKKQGCTLFTKLAMDETMEIRLWIDDEKLAFIISTCWYSLLHTLRFSFLFWGVHNVSCIFVLYHKLPSSALCLISQDGEVHPGLDFDLAALRETNHRVVKDGALVGHQLPPVGMMDAGWCCKKPCNIQLN